MKKKTPLMKKLFAKPHTRHLRLKMLCGLCACAKRQGGITLPTSLEDLFDKRNADNPQTK
jgi:hypothetical protein